MNRFLDAIVLLFAGWTLLVHRVVALKGSLSTLLHWSLPTLLGVAAVILWIWKETPTIGESSHFEVPRSDYREILIVGVGVLGSLGVWIQLWYPDLFWSYGIAVLALFTLTGIRKRVDSDDLPRPAGILFIVVLTVALLLTMSVKRPDIDDSYYLGMAVSVKESSEKPLLCCDFVHLRDDFPISKPSDQLRSLEVLLGVLSFLTRSAPIVWAHIALPFIGTLFAVLATSRLLRILMPRQWTWALLAWLVILLSAGDAHRWYGNLAFVRMHQGKSLLVTACLPIIWVYALEYSKRRDLRSWGLLFAANVAAMGLNPTGIWLAPLATLAGFLSGIEWRSRDYLALLAGGLIPAYNLLTGFSIRSDMAYFMEMSLGTTSARTLMTTASRFVLGRSFSMGLIVASLIISFWLIKGRVPRRFILATVLVFLALNNPQWVRWIALHLTGGGTFWRAFWLIPVPLILALGVVSLGEAGMKKWPLSQRNQILVGVGLALILLVPSLRFLSSRNEVHWGWGLKVPEVEYQLAKYVVARSSPESRVLAPSSIAPWIATFEGRPELLVVRSQYLRSDLAPFDDLQNRNWMLQKIDEPAARFGRNRRAFFILLDRYEIDTLVFRTVLETPYKGRRSYRKAGFELRAVSEPYEVWVRHREAVMKASP